jgi:simple sugar transport system permease protein
MTPATRTAATPASPPKADERLRRQSSTTKLLRRPELGAFAGTVLVFILFGIWAGDSGLFSSAGIVNFLQVSAELGILATFVALLMIGGEFDLSLGSTVGFTGMVIAIGMTHFGLPLWLALLLAVGVAILVGFLNGIMVVRTGLPSFIVTLASMFILRGLTLALTRTITGRTQVPYVTEGIEGSWLVEIFAGHVFGGTVFGPKGLPVSILWWIGLTALATWVLLRARFGNWIFAVGGDANAARNIGVPLARVKILLFMGTACAAALFATIQVLESGSADTLRGTNKEFEAIIAAVIGGNLLSGGYGSAIGAALGSLIFGTVEMGIFYTGIDTDWFKVFLGLVVLIAVLFNNYIRRKVTEAR